MADIFLSYAKEDRLRVELLVRALEARGWSLWWDTAIPAGKTYDQVIEEALNTARCVVVIWSNESIASRWVRTEADEGANREILVPVLLDNVKIPLAFRTIQAVNLIGWRGDLPHPGIDQLVRDISALIGMPAASGQELQPAPTAPALPDERRTTTPLSTQQRFSDFVQQGERVSGLVRQAVSSLATNPILKSKEKDGAAAPAPHARPFAVRAGIFIGFFLLINLWLVVAIVIAGWGTDQPEYVPLLWLPVAIALTAVLYKLIGVRAFAGFVVLEFIVAPSFVAGQGSNWLSSGVASGIGLILASLIIGAIILTARAWEKNRL
jgi:hypothetical protein